MKGSPVLIRYADLSRDPDKSAYAESRVMPSCGLGSLVVAGFGWLIPRHNLGV